MPGLVSNLLSLLSPSFWRQQYANWRARLFDLRYGIETDVVVPVAEIRDVDAELASHAVQYEPSTLPKFERAMRASNIDRSRYTFVDYGSGKGRVLLLAAELGFGRVIGIEMSASLNAIAADNVERAARRNSRLSRIELVCADARSPAVPPGDLVAYFYNPFDAELLGEMRDRLLAAVHQDPRELIVVYVNPVHREVFDQVPALRCLYDDKTTVVWRRED